MEESGITVVGYCEPVSCRGGDSVELKLSSEQPGPLTIDIVEMICGDRGNPATGLREREVRVDGFPITVEGRPQPLRPGSSARFGPSATLETAAFTIGFAIRPSLRPDHPQAVLSIGDATLWWTRDGLTLDPDGDEHVGPLQHHLWYTVRLSVDDDAGRLEVEAHPTHSPGTDSTLRGGAIDLHDVAGRGDTLVVGQGFDGRIADLWMATTADAAASEATFRWDASIATESDRWHDVGPHELHGLLQQLPARAVRGPRWDGSCQDPSAAPEHYDSVHFHSDDLYDAGWETAATLEIPSDLPSGAYCFRTRSDHGLAAADSLQGRRTTSPPSSWAGPRSRKTRSPKLTWT